jgi:mannose-1-phosphate guanylyltransferase
MCSVPRFWEKVYAGVQEKISQETGLRKAMMLDAIKVGRTHNIDYLRQGKTPPMMLHLKYKFYEKTIYALLKKTIGIENGNFFPTAGAAAPDGSKESMVQRVVRQLRETGICDSITVATSQSQRDIIINQLGEEIPVVTEPERRDTFPAIALASSYLAYKRKCSTDEIIIVMPCDPYTETGYFETIRRIADAVKNNVAELVLMGINPTYPSAKYGYVVPVNDVQNKGIFQVSRFTEKPDMITAEKLISEGAFWNGGVFAFRLGYMTDIVTRHIKTDTFSEIRSRYGEFPKISFDYEVAEKAQSVAVVPFAGEWKDLGTWNTLTDELSEHTMGNVVMDEESENTHVINELGLPIMCIGTRNLVIAASNDGILISDKDKSENIKTYADCLQHRPMFEERRWGEYKVVDTAEFSDGYKSLTKQLKIKSGKSISYQVHRHRDEVWTFIDGEGELVLDDIRSVISRGDTITIKKGVKHAVRAISELTFIEVQSGNLLAEEDIEQFDYKW